MEKYTPPTLDKAGPGDKRTPAASPEAKPAKPRRSGMRWLWLPVVALLAIGAWYLWPKGGATITTSAGAPSKGGKKGGSGVIPVVAAKARKSDIAVYITGLGSVIPVYTVT